MPLYDNIADAFALTGSNTQVFTITGATLETNEASQTGYPGIWLKLDLSAEPAGARAVLDIDVDVDSGPILPYLDTYRVTGPTWNPASPDFLTDFGYWGTPSVGDGTATPPPVVNETIERDDSYNGVWYFWLGDWDFSTTTGAFSVTWAITILPPPPPGDEKPDAIALGNSSDFGWAVGGGCIEGTTDGASPDYGNPDYSYGYGVYDADPNIWYEIYLDPWDYSNGGTESATGLHVELEELTATALQVEVFRSTGTSPTIGALLGSDTGLAPSVDVDVAGLSLQFYRMWVRVSSPSGQEGTFKLKWWPTWTSGAPANNGFASAELLTGYTDSTTGTTVGATAECDETFSWQVAPDYNEAFSLGTTLPSVWYKYVVPENGRIEVRSNIDPYGPPYPNWGNYVFLWRGPSIDALEQVTPQYAWVDNASSLGIYGDVVSGETVYIQVVAQANEGNDFVLSLTLNPTNPPINDDFADAIVLTGTGTEAGTISGATVEAGEPNSGNTYWIDAQSVWYKITATTGGGITLSLSDLDVTHLYYINAIDIILYEGTSLDNLTQKAIFTGNTALDIAVEEGKTYYVKISSPEGWTSFTLNYDINLEQGEWTDENWDTYNGGASIINGELRVSANGAYATKDVYPNGHGPTGVWFRFNVKRYSGGTLWRYNGNATLGVLRARDSAGANLFSIDLVGNSASDNWLTIKTDAGASAFSCKVGLGSGPRMTKTGPLRVECFYQRQFGWLFIYVDGQFVGSGAITTSKKAIRYFDAGFYIYPTNPTAQLPLDAWDFGFSNFVARDNPALGPWGKTGSSHKEIIQQCGFSWGSLSGTNKIVSLTTGATVVTAPTGEDGYAMVVNGGVSNSFQGAIFEGTHGNHIGGNDNLCPLGDSTTPGYSYKFYCEDYPTAKMRMSYFRTPSNAFQTLFIEGGDISIDQNGDLWIRPTTSDPYVKFCTAELNRWHYIEVKMVQHAPKWTAEIFFDDKYMGIFTTTVDQPYAVAGPSTCRIGKWTSSIGTPSIYYKDIAFTRHLVSRPLGPVRSALINISGQGTPRLGTSPPTPEPDTDFWSSYGDLNSGTDASGQPYGFTAFDTLSDPIPPLPAGTIRQPSPNVLGGCTLELATEGSGPVLDGADYSSLNAMKVTITDKDHFTEGAAFGFGLFGIQYPFDRSMVIEAWVKGPAGRVIGGDSNIPAAWDSQGSSWHTLTGDWQLVRIYMNTNWPHSTTDAYLQFHFTKASTSNGDIFYFKRIRCWTDPPEHPTYEASNWYKQAPFKWSDDGGSTIGYIPLGDGISSSKINAFPPPGNKEIYNTPFAFDTGFTGRDTNDLTRAPEMFENAGWYLEWLFETQTEDPISLKALMTTSGHTSGSEATKTSGKSHFHLASNNTDRFGFQYTDGTANRSFPIPMLPGDQPWTKERLQELRMRWGLPDRTGWSNGFYNDFALTSVLKGLAIEAFFVDTPVAPPSCAGDVDLSRIRFRAWEANDV